MTVSVPDVGSVVSDLLLAQLLEAYMRGGADGGEHAGRGRGRAWGGGGGWGGEGGGGGAGGWQQQQSQRRLVPPSTFHGNSGH